MNVYAIVLIKNKESELMLFKNKSDAEESIFFNISKIMKNLNYLPESTKKTYEDILEKFQYLNNPYYIISSFNKLMEEASLNIVIELKKVRVF